MRPAKVLRFACGIGLFAAAATAPSPAGSEEVPTGANIRLARSMPLQYTHVFTVYQIDGAGGLVLAFGDGAHPGDAYDVVDNRGYVGRLMVDQAELHGCGSARYYDVRASFVGKPPNRPVLPDYVLALAPARRRPLHARVIPGSEVADAPEGKEGLQAIDLDGDGQADLLHYQFHTCGRHKVSDDSAACFETWERTDKGWRRIEHAEFPICNPG